MHVSTLKKFNDIVDITDNGDYEAHSKDGKLFAAIGSFDQTAILYVTTPIQDDLHIFTNVKMINKYLDLFDGIMEIKSSENAILMSDSKTEVLLPMVSAENAAKHTKTLKQEVVYQDALTIDIPVSDLSAVSKSSKKQEDAIIKFNMAEFLTIDVGKVKRKLKDLTGKPYQWCFKQDVMERTIGQAQEKVTFTLPYNDQMPVKVEYNAGAVSVVGYMMRIFE